MVVSMSEWWNEWKKKRIGILKDFIDQVVQKAYQMKHSETQLGYSE